MKFTKFIFKFLYLQIFLIILGCSSPNENKKKNQFSRNQKGEYIYRKHTESVFIIPKPEKMPAKLYPWDKDRIGDYPKITKEFFRCKGSTLNPCHIIQQKMETVRYYDCGGIDKHSLPLREGKEFIYPILIELLNYIQINTQKRVVITSGHRCMDHNLYSDPTSENQYSKHLIGAEVSFYVQGLEEKPEVIISLIQNFYSEQPVYKNQPEYQEFKRYEKNDTNVSIPPWFNKEVFVKIFQKNEGRNFDNRHPYPYISIQVRYDKELNEKVSYSWDRANKNYHRW